SKRTAALAHRTWPETADATGNAAWGPGFQAPASPNREPSAQASAGTPRHPDRGSEPKPQSFDRARQAARHRTGAPQARPDGSTEARDSPKAASETAANLPPSDARRSRCHEGIRVTSVRQIERRPR